MSNRQSSARTLAPLALVLFVVVLSAIVFTSGGGEGGGGGSKAGEEAQTQPEGRGADTRATTTKTTPAVRVYVVKSGDNLGSIAEEVGVPIERIEELNPDIDPRALVTGQKIKTR